MMLRRNGGGLVALSVGALALGTAFLPTVGAAATPAAARQQCPMASVSAPAAFEGVTEVSASESWAVGFTGGGAPDPVVAHWDGGSWSTVSDSALESPGILNAVSRFPHGAWAAGASGTAKTGRKPLLLSLTSAAITPQKLPAGLSGQLTAVTAHTATDAWAGGFLTKGAALLLHWNGKSWTRTAFSGKGRINGIADISMKNAWAIDTPKDGFSQLWHWNGKAWSQAMVTGINNLAGYTLTAIAAGSPGDIWTVGFGDGGHGPVTLTMRWSGTKWVVVKSPNPNNANGASFAALSITNGQWAVGQNPGFPVLTERFLGNRWQIVTASECGQLTGVASGPGQVWAVGNNGPHRPFILQFDGQSWKPVQLNIG